MNDQNFHEIQLSGKQLLFGFMSAVVLLVVIFLLGVSVGRGVRPGQPPDPTTASATPGVPGDTTVSTATNPQAAPAAGDLNYAAVLKGQPAPRPDTQPDAAKSSEDTPPAAPKTEPAAPPAKPDAQTAKPEPPAPPPTTKPAPANGWFTQVGAYRTRTAADSIVKQLKANGFEGKVFPFQTMFRVRVGPFATNAEAEQARQRLLKAGFSLATVTR